MAKIIGNTTATPNPRPDWNQMDETKADYIKNRTHGLYKEHLINTATNDDPCEWVLADYSSVFDCVYEYDSTLGEYADHYYFKPGIYESSDGEYEEVVSKYTALRLFNGKLEIEDSGRTSIVLLHKSPMPGSVYDITYTGTMQLDAKYLPIDNHTIKVNGYGKLQVTDDLLEGKLDKVTEATYGDSLYAVRNGTGEQFMQKVGGEPITSYIPRYNANKTIKSSTPVVDDDCANKAYVDAATEKLNTATNSTTANTLVLRDDNGFFGVRTPTGDSHPAHKGYVDNAIWELEDRLNQQYANLYEAIDNLVMMVIPQLEERIAALEAGGGGGASGEQWYLYISAVDTDDGQTISSEWHPVDKNSHDEFWTTCPLCGATLGFNNDVVEVETSCPVCNQDLRLSWGRFEAM